MIHRYWNKVKQKRKRKKKKESDVNIPFTAKFPMFSLFIDGPNYQYIQNGATTLYNVGGHRFIALTSAKNVSAESLSEIIDAYFKDFRTGVGPNCKGYTPEKFNVEGKEVEINGTKFWRFEGELWRRHLLIKRLVFIQNTIFR